MSSPLRVLPLAHAVRVVLLALLIPTAARAQAPAWSVDGAAFTRSMHLVGASVAPAGAGDRVAAFVGSEIRGVAEAQAVATASGLQWRFFLTVYSRTSGETVAFRFYDASADAVVVLGETVAFTANALVGSVEKPFLWRAPQVVAACTSGAPGWSVAASSYRRSMALTGALAAGAGDRVAAFVGSEIRGVAEAQAIATASGLQWRFFLTVYSRTSGETVAFRFYDASADAVVVLGETVAFTANALVGSVEKPFLWKALPCSGGTQVSPALMLGGFYYGGSLRATRSSVLPLLDPYGLGEAVPPGFFTGTPTGQTVVDWVVVELRTGNPAAPPMSTASRAAALLLADGRVVDPGSLGAVPFAAPPGRYYLVLRHASHLAVMSALPINCSSGACAYDFTPGASQAYGLSSQRDLSGSGIGPWALVPGNADGDDDVDTDDFLAWNRAFGTTTAYVAADLDGDGDVDTDDFLVWHRAFGTTTRVPPATLPAP